VPNLVSKLNLYTNTLSSMTMTVRSPLAIKEPVCFNLPITSGNSDFADRIILKNQPDAQLINKFVRFYET
jgi:hypothetical protein